ncbi:MAG TPA: hypothetical protein VGE35_03775 [Candidatus Paceibacterota bacterium]
MKTRQFFGLILLLAVFLFNIAVWFLLLRQLFGLLATEWATEFRWQAVIGLNLVSVVAAIAATVLTVWAKEEEKHHYPESLMGYFPGRPDIAPVLLRRALIDLALCNPAVILAHMCRAVGRKLACRTTVSVSNKI